MRSSGGLAEQGAEVAGARGFGLREQVLSPIETLSQSISTIAPTTSPAMTVPLVFALAGNGTWLAYLFALSGVLLMALCIARFARHSAAPGSLYVYATSSLPAALGCTAGWALLLAYVATGASVVGGFINYANVLSQATTGRTLPTVLLALTAVAAATAVAYRDVQVSARMMLWIEAVSVAMIAAVLLLLVWQNGLHVDLPQVRLHGVSGTGVRLGVVLALFSFVGFESATTLGAEAKNPLRTIPRAVIQSAVLAGAFFLLCAYVETLGFRAAGRNLGTSEAPMRVLAALAGVPVLGPLIDVGAFVSMFACTLACITAAARVLLHIARDGYAPQRCARAHATNETPGFAVLVVGLATLVLACLLAGRGVSGADIYAWMGSLAVYGFITAYGLVAVALPIYLKRIDKLTWGAVAVACGATVAMVLALAGTLYPVPPRPYNWLPYVYAGYLLLGLAGFNLTRRKRGVAL